ncbi:triosephosphate isomerase [Clostridia bacterium]|nr:triosephosphate isomerase [Clostridia bacterium]
MRRPIIAGNWKLNKTPLETVALIQELKPLVAESGSEVVVCPPAACLFAAKSAIAGSTIKLGAQDMYFEDTGAFTGETSAQTLFELGVEYVILGHSERRQHFAETDASVNKKVMKAIERRLKPILCVGENLEERQNGVTSEVVRSQTKLALLHVGEGNVPDIVIAYEPVWAIGTGLSATSVEAENTIREIRSTVAELYSSDTAAQIRILYGGSMKPDNMKSLMSMTNIDGGLIGGASLKASDFSQIVNFQS